jgi:hypothetical protein
MGIRDKCYRQISCCQVEFDIAKVVFGTVIGRQEDKNHALPKIELFQEFMHAFEEKFRGQ